MSIQATRRGVGIGSSAHDFLGMASINFRTSCSVSRVKLVIGSIEDTTGWESVLLNGDNLLGEKFTELIGKISY